MKKLYKFIILGALAVSVASCEKDISPIEHGPDQGKQIRTEVIGVKTESEATKVTLSGTTYGWVDGDEIAVWTGTNATSGSFQDCEVSGGKISVTLGEGQARYNYAIYPAAVKDASNYGQGTLNVILPSSYTLAQVSGENTPLPMVAVNDKESSNLTFYNVAGLLRVTVKAIPSDATGLLFQFPGKKVNGTFAVTNPGAGTSTISNAAPGLGEDQIAVTFAAGTASEMTLNIPLPTGDYDDVYITPVGSSTKVAAARHIKAGGYTASRARGRQLTATLVSFSVSSTGKVVFAPGNLQLINGSTWQFASHQYDYFGESQTDNQRDLFSYSTGYTYTCPSPWRVLTAGASSESEWGYVLNTRSVTNSLSANARYTMARIGDTKGLIIFPDNYSHPDGTDFTGGTYNAPSDYTSTVSISGWEKMEVAGAIFLPAAGYFTNNAASPTYKEVGVDGAYYSNTIGYTASNEMRYYSIYFSGNWQGASLMQTDDFGWITTRRSVRPVRDLE